LDVVAHREQAEQAEQAEHALDLAVDELRQSGRDDTLPRALLARAGLRRFLDDRDEGCQPCLAPRARLIRQRPST
jgi:hypothetical protein